MDGISKASENARESFDKFAKAVTAVENKANQPREYIPPNKKHSKKYKIRMR